MNPTSLILALIEAQDQTRIYHWGTSSFAEHNAFGSLYDSIASALDKIAESSMKDGTRFNLESYISVENYDTKGAQKYISDLSESICRMCENDKLCCDIQNILQDLLADINKTLYLLTLK